MNCIIAGKVRLDVQRTELASVIDAAVSSGASVDRRERNSTAKNFGSASRSGFGRSQPVATNRLELALQRGKSLRREAERSKFCSNE